jgi:peptidoglycan/LPS O-acetylase OafA/YrhL
MTISQRFDPRHNSLNFLRLVFALAVVVSHTWPLGAYGPDPKIAGQTLGTWAVAGFFGISGFLISNSRLHLAFVAFSIRRVLRIFPAFLVCLLVIILILAPFSTLFDHGSIQWSSAASFFYRNAFLKVEQNGIAGTLTHSPYAPAWDGSLWTLFWEFACYMVIGALLGATRRWHRPLVVATFLVVTVAATIEWHGGGLRAIPVEDFTLLGSFFFAGSILALYSDRIPLDWRLAVGAIVLLPISSALGVWELVGSLPVAYVCLWLGVVLPFHSIGRRNDISYGVYIYAYPMQQILVAMHANHLPVGVMVMLSILVTLPLAVASWFIIEKPALSLKSRLGRRPAQPAPAQERLATPEVSRS